MYIKRLAEWYPKWRLLVVGDINTPEDWSGGPNVVYLSSKTQAKLGYRIDKYATAQHVGRKNIGYLYAIANGAKSIYEIDDHRNSNLDLLESKALAELRLQFVMMPTQSSVGDQLAINPCDYFGQPYGKYQVRRKSTHKFLCYAGKKLNNSSSSSFLPVWPRGFPLELIEQKHELKMEVR